MWTTSCGRAEFMENTRRKHHVVAPHGAHVVWKAQLITGARDEPSTTLSSDKVRHGARLPRARGPAQACSTAARPPVHATALRTQPVRALRMMCSAHGATRPVSASVGLTLFASCIARVSAARRTDGLERADG